jgi:hypothetical protein
MHRLRIVAIVAALALAPTVAACGSGSSSSGDKSGSTATTGATANQIDVRRIDSGNSVRVIDNPWYPLKPGTGYRYRGMKDGKPGIDVLSVTGRTKMIMGVPATVVRDSLYLNGRLAEDTADFYGQDGQGNVWYLGEATKELDSKGKVTSTEGSWQAGVNGAKAGIFMPAHPKVGQAFRQEYYKGQAEDHFKVVSVDASVSVPYVSTHHALKTNETTPLEPGVLDLKYYVRGVGTVYEATVKGGQERWELVSLKSR